MGSLRKTSPAGAFASDRASDRANAWDSAWANDPTAAGTTVRWDAVGAAEWNAFCADAGAAYQQDYAYGEVLKAVGVRLRRAQLLHDGRWIGAAQVQIRRFFGVFTLALVLRGPVWAHAGGTDDRGGEGPADAVRARLIEAMRRTLPVSGLHALVVAPDGGGDDGLAAAGCKRIMTGWHTVMLDLTQDEAALRAGLNGKWRNRLKAAEKAGVTVAPFGRRPDRYAWLLARDEEQQQARGYRAMPAAMVRGYHERAGRTAVLGYAAQRGAEKLGGVLFLRHGSCATYHVGWAGPQGKEANVHNLLLWTAIRGLKKAGVKTLDLGGADTEAGPGLARFKIGTGGQALSLSGSWTRGPRWR